MGRIQDKRQGRLSLPLLPGESIVLADQGFLKKNSRSGWKPGHLTLTDQRLVMHQQTRDIFSAPLDSILSVATVKKGFVLKRVDALLIGYTNAVDKSSSRVWILVKEPLKWQQAIFHRTKVQISEAELERVCGELEPESRGILHHIWDRGHADLSELADILEAPGQWEVLNRIKNRINPLSEKLLGFPMLVFESSRKDPLTKKHIPNSWWIMGPPGLAGHLSENGWRALAFSASPYIDIFDEQDEVLVLLEIGGARKEDIVARINEGRLKLRCSSPVNPFSEELLLPCPVVPESLVMHASHGIVEIRMRKD